ncbi:hypothetical protein ACWF94_37580, partial [Streptomyces sp. NPDC055078]
STPAASLWAAAPPAAGHPRTLMVLRHHGLRFEHRLRLPGVAVAVPSARLLPGTARAPCPEPRVDDTLRRRPRARDGRQMRMSLIS